MDVKTRALLEARRRQKMREAAEPKSTGAFDPTVPLDSWERSEKPFPRPPKLYKPKVPEIPDDGTITPVSPPPIMTRVPPVKGELPPLSSALKALGRKEPRRVKNPSPSTKRNKMLSFCVSEQEKAVIQEYVDVHHINFSKWMRELVFFAMDKSVPPRG